MFWRMCLSLLNNCMLLSTGYCMQVSMYFIYTKLFFPIVNLGGSYYYYLYFTDVETDA